MAENVNEPGRADPPGERPGVPADGNGPDLPRGDAGAGSKEGGNALALGIALGTALGVAFGLALDNLALGVGMGIAIGVALGAGVQERRRRPPAE